MSLPLIIGHRSAKAMAPENTLAALRQAAALGVCWVEVDVRLTADGVPVLLHDATLERTTNGHGALAAMALVAVEQLDAGSWFGQAFVGEPIPTLERFLIAAAGLGIGVNLELKATAGDAEQLTASTVAVTRRVWPVTSPAPLLSSFESTCLEVAAHLAPAWPRGVLLATLAADSQARADRVDARFFVVNHECLNGADDVALLAKDGRDVLAYTVNAPERAADLWRWGVASVITDRPDKTMSEKAKKSQKHRPGVVLPEKVSYMDR